MIWHGMVCDHVHHVRCVRSGDCSHAGFNANPWATICTNKWVQLLLVCHLVIMLVGTLQRLTQWLFVTDGTGCVFCGNFLDQVCSLSRHCVYIRFVLFDQSPSPRLTWHCLHICFESTTSLWKILNKRMILYMWRSDSSWMCLIKCCAVVSFHPFMFWAKTYLYRPQGWLAWSFQRRRHLYLAWGEPTIVETAMSCNTLQFMTQIWMLDSCVELTMMKRSHTFVKEDTMPWEGLCKGFASPCEDSTWCSCSESCMLQDSTSCARLPHQVYQ